MPFWNTPYFNMTSSVFSQQHCYRSMWILVVSEKRCHESILLASRSREINWNVLSRSKTFSFFTFSSEWYSSVLLKSRKYCPENQWLVERSLSPFVELHSFAYVTGLRTRYADHIYSSVGLSLMTKHCAFLCPLARLVKLRKPCPLQHMRQGDLSNWMIHSLNRDSMYHCLTIYSWESNRRMLNFGWIPWPRHCDIHSIFFAGCNSSVKQN